VKVNNILTMMGSGVVLALTGVILIVSAAALGINAAFPTVPPWVSFLVVGIIVTGIGVFLLSRSGTETTKKIEKVERQFTFQKAWEKKPWLMLAGSVAAGFITQRLLRSMFFSDQKTPETVYEAETFYEQQKEKEEESDHSTVKDFVMKPLGDLARYAASRAITLGSQMIVAPMIMKAVHSFIEKNNLKQAYAPGSNGQADYSHANGNGSHQI